MLNWLDQSFRDVRFAARSLVKNPGFTSVAVLSLAMGIMATTAIYSVLYGVVLNPFPYKDVDRLMSVRVSNAAMRGYRTGYSVDQFIELAERNTIFGGHPVSSHRRSATSSGSAKATRSGCVAITAPSIRST